MAGAIPLLPVNTFMAWTGKRLPLPCIYLSMCLEKTGFAYSTFYRPCWCYLSRLVWQVYFYKNTNHQQMHKESFIINRNTLLHVSTMLGHLQGELFCYRYTKVALHSWVRMYCWLRTAGVYSLRCPPAGRDHREFTPPKTTQYAVNSTFSLNYKVQP
jgi:hypothetical protein